MLNLTGNGTLLNDLINELPENERYSHVYDGNSEALDQIFLSNSLHARPLAYQVAHVNSDFWDQSSDHEPQVVNITLSNPTTFERASFSPDARPGSVLVKWTAAHGNHLAGVNLYRGDTAGGLYLKPNGGRIPWQDLHNFAWLDRDAQAGKEYFYRIELMDDQGGGQMRGLFGITAGPAAKAFIYLPVISH